MAPEHNDPRARKNQDWNQADGEPSLATTPRAHEGQKRPSSNAGIRRNRLPTGVIAWQTKVHFSPELKLTLVAAAQASGNLSPSLYLERLLAQLADKSGSLPVLNIQLDRPLDVKRQTAT